MPDPRPLSGVTPELAREIRAHQQRIARQRRRIAVVGMSCRFPGGADVPAFWRSLLASRDTATKGRPDAPARGEGAAFGCYLRNVDRFDAEFFRTAPVEAEFMDPQQRLLLEVSWEALEDAGMDPGWERRRAGVYVGIGSGEYQALLGGLAPTVHSWTGTSFAAAAGRIAFTLGWRGPAIAVDTACSSSLVAIHQAIAGLQRGEADLALAGGVNVILRPHGMEALEDAGVLSPDGRCKTFDAAADGFVRGEGCGMLVLKRLSDAERDGDRILGVLLGSAVNQDGASAGLTVPNGPAQEEVIREALGRRAGMDPGSSVDYLEAHGTGTELGDPIEVRAAASVYGEGREAERPLLLGSVKTNVGHLEAAAGVAGVVKVLLAMQSRSDSEAPALRNPEPADRVGLAAGAGDGGGDPVAGAPGTVRWRAGVSSFGLVGDERARGAGGVWGRRWRSGTGSGRSAGLRPASPAGGWRNAVCFPPVPRTAAVCPRVGRRWSELAGRYRELLSGDGEWDGGAARGPGVDGGDRSQPFHRIGRGSSSGTRRNSAERLAVAGGAGAVERGIDRIRGRLRSCIRARGASGRGWGRSCTRAEPVFRSAFWTAARRRSGRSGRGRRCFR